MRDHNARIRRRFDSWQDALNDSDMTVRDCQMRRAMFQAEVEEAYKAGHLISPTPAALDRLADADMEQAALVERAAGVCKHFGDGAIKEADDEDVGEAGRKALGIVSDTAFAIRDAIRTLAPDAGVKALSALRAERDRIDQWRETAIVERDTYSEERDDALRQLADAQADRDRLAAKLAEAEAQVAALREAATNLMRVFPDPCRHDHHGYCQEHFIEAECSVLALKNALAASPALTPAEQQLFDASMAMRDAAGQIAKEQME